VQLCLRACVCVCVCVFVWVLLSFLAKTLGFSGFSGLVFGKKPHTICAFPNIIVLFTKFMRWKRLVGSLDLQVFSAREPYFSRPLLQKRSIILLNLLISTTSYYSQSLRTAAITPSPSACIIAPACSTATRTHANMHTYTLIRARARTHKHTHTSSCKHTNTHTYTHKQRGDLSCVHNHR